MTMFREVDWFDVEKFPTTAAEMQEGTFAIVGAWKRAQWESGYTAGLANAQPTPCLFNQLRANEETIARLAAQLAEARAWAGLWKRSAHDNRLRLKLCVMGWDGASELNQKLLAENGRLVSQQLQPATAGESAGSDVE